MRNTNRVKICLVGGCTGRCSAHPCSGPSSRPHNFASHEDGLGTQVFQTAVSDTTDSQQVHATSRHFAIGAPLLWQLVKLTAVRGAPRLACLPTLSRTEPCATLPDLPTPAVEGPSCAVCLPPPPPLLLLPGPRRSVCRVSLALSGLGVGSCFLPSFRRGKVCDQTRAQAPPSLPCWWKEALESVVGAVPRGCLNM